MKGLIALFLAIVLLGIAWRYTPGDTRAAVKRAAADNFLIIAIAIAAVAIAAFVSTNSILRLI